MSDLSKPNPAPMTHVLSVTQLGPIGTGSVVSLKSGGPDMTVIETSATRANCVWTDQAGSVHDFWLPLAALVRK